MLSLAPVIAFRRERTRLPPLQCFKLPALKLHAHPSPHLRVFPPIIAAPETMNEDRVFFADVSMLAEVATTVHPNRHSHKPASHTVSTALPHMSYSPRPGILDAIYPPLVPSYRARLSRASSQKVEMGRIAKKVFRRADGGNQHAQPIHHSPACTPIIVTPNASPTTDEEMSQMPVQGGDIAGFVARRRDFLRKLTRPSPRHGHVRCRLCSSEVWAPNGRYHMESCHVLCRERKRAHHANFELQSVNGIRVSEDLFAKPKQLKPKLAKIPGFVMSRTVLLNDPNRAPELGASQRESGRKGYVRCLTCNEEVFAPNTRRHAKVCSRKPTTDNCQRSIERSHSDLSLGCYENIATNRANITSDK